MEIDHQIVASQMTSDESKPNSDSGISHKIIDSQSTSFSRRETLKKSALLSSAALGGGIGATTLVGTAAASVGACGENNPGNYNDVNYVWQLGDHKSAVDQTCGDTRTNHKIDHGSALIYRGSCNYGGDGPPEWHHLFNSAAHVESFEQAYPDADCDGTWDHASDVEGHRVTINNQNYYTSIDKPQSADQVGGHPEASSDGDSSITFGDIAFTGLSTAMGYYSGWAGAAVGVAGALVSGGESDMEDGQDPALMFDWDYQNSKKCGSHYLQFEVEGNPDVQFNHTDEAWGLYPNYTQIQKSVYFNEPADCPDQRTVISVEDSKTGSANKSTTHSSSEQDLIGSVSPQVGDVIQTKKGESVSVDDIRVEVAKTPCTSERKVEIADLPDGISNSANANGEITYKEFSATTTTISIDGTIIE